MSSHGSMLMDDRPIMFSPRLASALGSCERALVLQQIHWLLQNPRNGITQDGHRWVYGTYEEWCAEYFTMWSAHTLRKHIQNLERQGVLISAQLRAKQHDRTKFYRIDYKTLGSIRPDVVASDEPDTDASERPDADDSIYRTKTSTKTSTEGETQAPAQPPPQRVDASPTHHGQPKRDYKYRPASQPAENTKAARELGISPSAFREMSELVLEITGKQALANCEGKAADQALYDAQGAALNLARMGYPTPDAIRTVHESWQENDWRGKTAPTFEQLQEHASAMIAGTHRNKFESRKDNSNEARWQRSQEVSTGEQHQPTPEEEEYYRNFFREQAVKRAAESAQAAEQPKPQPATNAKPKRELTAEERARAAELAARFGLTQRAEELAKN